MGGGVRHPAHTCLAALDKRLHWGQAPFLNVRVMPGITVHLEKKYKAVTRPFHVLPCNLTYHNPWKLEVQVWGQWGPVKTRLGSFLLEIQPPGAPVPMK